MRKFKKLFLLLLLFFVLARTAFSINEKIQENTVVGKILSPLADPKTFVEDLSKPNLTDTVQKSLEGTKGTYGIYIKNLKTGETYTQLDQMPFTSASLYKLWVMAVVVDRLEKGSMQRQEVLTADIVDLNKAFNIASESAELKEGKISLSTNSALSQMITISHNYAALLLAKKVGLASVAKFLKDNGFSESHIGSPPQTSARDMGSFFEKLYTGKIGNNSQSSQMLTLLRLQQINDRIPGLLPEGIEVAHKTGEIDFYKHDAGIVFGKKSDYIIVLLSKTSSPKAAVDRMAELSKAVYDYFEN